MPDSVPPVAPSASGAEYSAWDGLVWGYRFNEDGKAEPLDGRAAMAALERRDSWVWLHFDLVDGRARRLLGELPHLPEEARELLVGPDDRQRLITIDDAVAGVVADFQREHDLDPRHMQTWRFCMVPHAFISARRSRMHTMAVLREAVEAGRSFAGVLHLFDGIVHGYANALSAVTHRLSDELDSIEDGLLEPMGDGDFELLGQVRRRAVRLVRQATPLRVALHGLLDEQPTWFTEDASEDCAHVAHRVDSVAADLVALQQRAHALHDELSARQTDTTNRRLMLLTVVSVAMVPPTLITGLFGMNVDGLPFKDNSPYGFLISLGIMAGSMAALLWGLRRARVL